MDNLISNTNYKENAYTIFSQINTNIYKVVKDRSGRFAKRVYVGAEVVIGELNKNEMVAITSCNPFSGIETLIHKNF